MSEATEAREREMGPAATTAAVSAGIAGLDAAVAMGIAAAARVAGPARLTIAGITFGVSFVCSFFALCLCKAASDADDYMDELQERGAFRQ